MSGTIATPRVAGILKNQVPDTRYNFPADEADGEPSSASCFTKNRVFNVIPRVSAMMPESGAFTRLCNEPFWKMRYLRTSEMITFDGDKDPEPDHERCLLIAAKV